MSKHVLAVGSFARGHEFYGPFDSHEDASIYAVDRSFPINSAHPIELEEPDGLNPDGDAWDGCNGQIVLLIGDGYNGFSVVGMFDSPESALDWEENYDADNQGYHVMWVEVRRSE